MSLFKTQVPIDIDGIKKLLPKDAVVMRLEYDARNQRLELLWHTSLLETPYTFHQDFPVDLLKARELPENTKYREQRAPTAEPPPAEPPAAKPKRPRLFNRKADAPPTP